MQNRFNVKQMLIGLLLMLCTSTGYSQQYASVYLKNGDRLTGRWFGADDQSARIEWNGQRLSIPIGDVNTIAFANDLNLIPDALAEKYFRNGEAFLELGMREEAKRRFMAAIEEFLKYAAAHYQLGLLLQEEGKVDEALKYFGYAVAINPVAHNMSAQFKQAGDAYAAAKEYRKAIDTYLLVSKYYPGDPNADYAAYTAGFLLAENLEDVEKGLTTLQEAKQRFPASTYLEKASYMIGLLQFKAGQAEQAIRTLTDFIQRYPESKWLASAYLARGNAYLQLKQNRDAIADFGRVDELTSDLKLRLEARKKRSESAWTVYTVSDGLPSNHIQAITVDGDTLWIGTPKGLAQVDISMESWQLLHGNVDSINAFNKDINVRALAVDGQELWIGTLNQGVIRYNKLTKLIEQYDTQNGLPHNQDLDIKMDDRDVWVGTFSGVARYDRFTGQWSVYNTANGLPANDIVAVAITPKTVWIGTSENGLALYDRDLNYWRSFGASDGLNARASVSIASFNVRENQLFFTWYNKRSKVNGYGVIGLDDLKSQVENVLNGDFVPLENIYIVTSEAELWIATNYGVYLKQQSWDQVDFPADRLADATVICITISKGKAWIGTSNGIAKIDKSALFVQK